MSAHAGEAVAGGTDARTIGLCGTPPGLEGQRNAWKPHSSPPVPRGHTLSSESALSRGTMTLRLRVVSDQRRSLGDRGSIIFTVDGGTIGRSADNDWVLPDPLRYVSAHHARVQYRNGSFYLHDVSTN